MSVTPEQELERLYGILETDKAIWEYLRQQYSILFSRAQAMFTLGALALTVTGFSGHRIVVAGRFSAVCLVAGLIMVLAGLGVAAYTSTRIRWLSLFHECDLRCNFLEMIRRRNVKTRLFNTALVIMMGGLGLYVAAVANFLLRAGKVMQLMP